MFNQVFGPSIYLLILDYFLSNPNQLVNLREIARSIGKNPGSVSRVVPRLIEEKYVEQIPVGNMYVFKLNNNNNIVQVLLEFRDKLEGVKR
jgi:hypothetical protein